MSDTTVEAKPKFNATAAIKKYAILLILIGFMVILAIVTGGTFLRSQNLINVVVQVAPLGIVALGMMFAIITKGIDLSVGSTVALVAVVSASRRKVWRQQHLPLAAMRGAMLSTIPYAEGWRFDASGMEELSFWELLWEYTLRCPLPQVQHQPSQPQHDPQVPHPKRHRPVPKDHRPTMQR